MRGYIYVQSPDHHRRFPSLVQPFIAVLPSHCLLDETDSFLQEPHLYFSPCAEPSISIKNSIRTNAIPAAVAGERAKMRPIRSHSMMTAQVPLFAFIEMLEVAALVLSLLVLTNALWNWGFLLVCLPVTRMDRFPYQFQY